MSDPDKRDSGGGNDNGAGVAITAIKWIAIVAVILIIAYVVLRIAGGFGVV